MKGLSNQIRLLPIISSTIRIIHVLRRFFLITSDFLNAELRWAHNCPLRGFILQHNPLRLLRGGSMFTGTNQGNVPDDRSSFTKEPIFFTFAFFRDVVFKSILCLKNPIWCLSGYWAT